MFFKPRCDVCGSKQSNNRDYSLACSLCLNKIRSSDLGFQRRIGFKIHNNYRFNKKIPEDCCVCGKLIDQSPKILCFECLPFHPDDTHAEDLHDPSISPLYPFGWRTNILNHFGWVASYNENKKGKELAISISCAYCGGCYVMTRIDGEKEHNSITYFEVGNSKSTKDPFYCTGLENGNRPKDYYRDEALRTSLRTKQRNCSHKWLLIAKTNPFDSDKNLSVEALYENIKEGDRDYKEFLTGTKYPSNKEMQSEAKFQYYSSWNEKQRDIYWCYKCGAKASKSHFRIHPKKLASMGLW